MSSYNSPFVQESPEGIVNIRRSGTGSVTPSGTVTARGTETNTSSNSSSDEGVVIDSKKEVDYCPIFDIYKHLEALKNESNLLSDINYLYKITEPTNNLQAIIIGSILYQKDFSKYIDPLREFRRYKSQLPTSPQDFQMWNIENVNPHYSDLNLYFNPYLPQNAYSSDLLQQHLALFSYNTFEYDSISQYEILQEMHLEENFHIGFHPNIVNSETPVLLESLYDLKNEDMVCFGVKDEILKTTTWRELKELFEKMNMFVNPFEKKKVFTKDQIERLLRIGRWILNNCNFSFDTKYKYLFEKYDKKTIEEIQGCCDVIENLKFMHQANFEFLNNVIQQFNNKTSYKKDKIRDGINKLYEATMFMRGWNGHNELPIENAHSTESESVQKRILESIFELDEINELTNNFIYSLPLMIWKNEFVQSVLEEQGLTIGERIELVKKGESVGIYSCVRMTSNVLGSSYCFYCRLFKMEPKFEIHRLSYIQ